MSNLQDEISAQVKKLRGQVETFVSDKVAPTLEKATTRLKATVGTTSRLEALIALLVSKGIITDQELKAQENFQPEPVQGKPDVVHPPAQD
jgi:hypothetical protein